MTRELAALCGANLLVLAAGGGVLLLLGAAESIGELAARIGLAYAGGLAAVGIVAATLALAHVPFGWPALGAFAVLAVGAGALRARTRPAGVRARAWPRERAVAAAAILLLLILVVRAWRAFAVVPVHGWDAWTTWTLKARALVELGWADPVLFSNEAYTNSAYPLLVPAVEAMGFHAMGGFREQGILVQFLFFGVALVGGLHGTLRDVVRGWLLWPPLLAIAAAPAVAAQLLTGYADVPLAAFTAVATAAGARWLLRRERWTLAVTTLFLAAALLTKYEAPVFVGAILLGLGLAVVPRGRRALLPVVAAAAAAAVPFALWRVYVSFHGLTTTHAGPGDLTAHPGVVPIALEWLAGAALEPGRWGLLVPLFLVATAAALAAGSRPLVLFALTATLLPLAGLAAHYALSPIPHTVYLEATADRVVSSIVLSCGALVPLLASEVATRRSLPAPAEARRAGTAP